MGRRFWCNGEYPLVPFLVLLSVLLPLSYPSQFTLTLAHALSINVTCLYPCSHPYFHLTLPLPLLIS